MSLWRSAAREDGFTLVELLVVMLVIGVLAAIVIPSFLSQQGKATDASAKALARTAQTAAHTYATDHSGSYVGISPAVLRTYEGSIPTSVGKGAYLTGAEALESGEGFKVTATAAVGGHTFSVIRKKTGAIERTCTPAGRTGSAGGGCQKSSW